MESYFKLHRVKALRVVNDWVYIKDIDKDIVHDILEELYEDNDVSYLVKKLINIIDNTYWNKFTLYIDNDDRDILLYCANELAEYVNVM